VAGRSNVRLVGPSSASAYGWGEMLRFSSEGNALPYLAEGWSTPEASFVWTGDYNVRLSFEVAPPESDIALIMRCAPYLAEGKIPHQEVHFFVNFLRVDFRLITASTEVEVMIPERVLSSKKLDIDLYLPKAASPASLQLGRDKRLLGICVSEMTLCGA
jgi:hypothetical protein